MLRNLGYTFSFRFVITYYQYYIRISILVKSFNRVYT